MVRLTERIGRRHPEVARRTSALARRYPDHAEEYLDRRTILLFGSLALTLDNELERRIFEAMRLAGAVVLELRV